MAQSRIVQGLMRLDNIDEERLYDLIVFDLDKGINRFDLADIYMGGEAERKLGNVLKSHPELRERLFIQSKGSIRIGDNGGYYDLSYKHIKEAVDASLARLGVDCLDSFLLHRPDIFFDAKEVSLAIEELLKENKIKHFGVSNFSKEEIEYLANSLNFPIEINQVQLGIGHTLLIDEALSFNMDDNLGSNKSGDTYFYMKRKGIALQAWSPYGVGFFEGSIFDAARYPQYDYALSKMADKYGVSKCAIATSFVLSLSKDITLITGSTDPSHIEEALEGERVNLSKEDWYTLYKDSGHRLP